MNSAATCSSQDKKYRGPGMSEYYLRITQRVGGANKWVTVKLTAKTDWGPPWAKKFGSDGPSSGFIAWTNAMSTYGIRSWGSWTQGASSNTVRGIGSANPENSLWAYSGVQRELKFLEHFLVSKPKVFDEQEDVVSVTLILTVGMEHDLSANWAGSGVGALVGSSNVFQKGFVLQWEAITHETYRDPTSG